MTEEFFFTPHFYDSKDRDMAGQPGTGVCRFEARSRTEAISRCRELIQTRKKPEGFVTGWIQLLSPTTAQLWSFWIDKDGVITKEECEYAP